MTNNECRIKSTSQMGRCCMNDKVNKKKGYELEERLIDFAVRIIKLSDSLPRTRAGNHVAGQIVRSGTSPAPNYGEAQDAESRKDFVHKIKIVLKELRETYVWLCIIQRARMVGKEEDLKGLVVECDELISIFVSSVKTAKRNFGTKN